ncbi:sugar kinase [Candidatus Bathyarchaeota archaeon]|nr:sugar kinase [Candidatus Bathyarchaeota archaeon]
MPEIISLGEALVEIMRRSRDTPFTVPAEFLGPYPSGAPAIFADAAARLGARSGFIGVVGSDDFGFVVADRLRRDGVDLSYFRIVEGYTTGIAFVAYRSDGSRRFIFHLRYSAASLLSPDDIDRDYIASARFLHVMGSALSVSPSSRDACYKAVRIASDSGVMVSFDPNLRPELLPVEEIREICRPILDYAYLILPSGEEATMLTGLDDPSYACDRLLSMGAEIVALKMGCLGSKIYTRGREIYIPAFKVDEVDPTGAGDTYDAGFVVGLSRGWSLEKTGVYANAAGALSVTRFGPMEGCPTLSEVEDLIRRQPPPISF